jgi:hypothetical protein
MQLLTSYKTIDKGREGEEKEVSSYWMTLRYWKLKEEALDSIL